MLIWNEQSCTFVHQWDIFSCIFGVDLLHQSADCSDWGSNLTLIALDWPELSSRHIYLSTKITVTSPRVIIIDYAKCSSGRKAVPTVSDDFWKQDVHSPALFFFLKKWIDGNRCCLSFSCGPLPATSAPSVLGFVFEYLTQFPSYNSRCVTERRTECMYSPPTTSLAKINLTHYIWNM